MRCHCNMELAVRFMGRTQSVEASCSAKECNASKKDLQVHFTRRSAASENSIPASKGLMAMNDGNFALNFTDLLLKMIFRTNHLLLVIRKNKIMRRLQTMDSTNRCI